MECNHKCVAHGGYGEAETVTFCEELAAGGGDGGADVVRWLADHLIAVLD
jgi:hypothetical protein